MFESTEKRLPPARALHRLSVLAVCLIWPLIWVGGLVTTYDAGMAVPDWPGTYGYNLFLYPLDTWLLGPFDLFIEHGHRLLGAVVGMVAIAMVFASRRDPRSWIMVLSVGVLLAVISQGVLGGIRVVMSDRTFAMIHGCVGPAVFSLCVLSAVVTSRNWWKPPGDGQLPPVGLGLVVLTVGLLVLSYLQLVLGAQIRHVQPSTTPDRFALIVAIHVITAFALWIWSFLAWLRLRRCGDLTLSRPAAGLIGLVTAQIGLGVGTWVFSYGWPTFLQWFPSSVGFLIRSKGFFDSIVVTAHVATGGLILAFSTLILVRTLRVRFKRDALASVETAPAAAS